MSEDPTRLVREDPDFARLVAASNRHEPSSKGLERTLSLVTEELTASRRSSSPRLLGTSIITGLAVIGAAVVTVVATQDAAPSPPRVAVTTSLGEAPSAAPQLVERSATPLSVSELPTAPAIEMPPPADEPPSTPTISTNGRRAAAPRGGDRPAAPTLDAPAAATPSTFSEELALLSSARSALETEDFSECIRAVDRYDARFPSGLFRQEVAVIRISALVKSGERARGEALARQFLATNVDSPYAGRVRALIKRP